MMCASLLVGCGGKKEETVERVGGYYNVEGYPICNDPIRIKVTGINDYLCEWNDTLMVQKVQEKLGIMMDCAPFTSDAWAQQYAVMLSTGDIPDMVISATMNRSQVDEDGESGFWLDFSQYLDLMPNMKAFMEKHPDWAAGIQNADGSIYSLTRYQVSETNLVYTQIYYDKTLTDAAGVTKLETVEDFYEALKLCKAKYPDKIPLGMTPNKAPGYRADMIIRSAFGVYSTQNTYMLAADKKDNIGLLDISDNYRQSLIYENKLYEEKLLDNNCFSMTSEQYKENIKNGKYIFYTDTTSLIMSNEDQKAYNSGTYNVMDKYEPLFCLTSDIQPKKAYLKISPVLDQARIFVNADSQYAEAICRLIDYFFTEEGILLSSEGIEGETYDLVDDGYGNTLYDHSEYWDSETYNTTSEWVMNDVAMHDAITFTWAHDLSYFNGKTVDELREMASDPSYINFWEAKKMLRYKETVEVEYESLLPFAYTVEENNERTTLRADIVNYVSKMKSSFMTGEVDPNDDKAWNAYVDQVKKMGYDRLMEIEQAAYDRLQDTLSEAK